MSTRRYDPIDFKRWADRTWTFNRPSPFPSSFDLGRINNEVVSFYIMELLETVKDLQEQIDELSK